MRVLYCVGNLAVGGLERFVTRISLRAKEGSDIEPQVCCLSTRSGQLLTHLESAGIPVYEAPQGWRRSRSANRSLSALIQRAAPDVVHSQVNFSLWQQFNAVRRAGHPLFCVTERSCYEFRGYARIRRMLQFHAIRAMGAQYSANGRAVADHVARVVRTAPSKIAVLPNGVPTSRPRPEVRKRVREALGWSPSVVGIGYVSRIKPDKGHPELVRAIRPLLQSGLPIKVCMVGDGPDRPLVERQVRDLGLSDHVHMTGTVSNVEDYLDAFDIVGLFSTREGMPNALLEAMMAGKAIIATSVGANPEILDNGNAGVLLSDRTDQTISAALEDVVKHPSRRNELGKAAFVRAHSEYSIETCFQRLIRLYKEALNQ